MTDMMNVTLALQAASVLAVIGTAWWMTRQAAAGREQMRRVDERLSHLASALELLTDTTESGMRSAFTELERVAGQMSDGGSRRIGLQKRIDRAARAGKSVREVAHAEQVSESEVGLRVKLAGRAARTKTAPAAPVNGRRVNGRVAKSVLPAAAPLAGA